MLPVMLKRKRSSC